ncbi:hypothetical protein B7P43_G05142 [Cryptotermes secundus]|uniref:Uncharacterized protein n=1 Tax=Cryptotermes secundus TaxID=105785 RepID=A0A2J7PEX9_9NEOP|nr:cilia- and flagella-associated protein 251 isoform X4 [Cryptotermes secundus]PNF14899.1 hypothetical protein B7P43_G05142 [Cryptotermes secundus]
MKSRYLKLAMTVLTAGVCGALPAFVLQPFLINNGAQLGTPRGGPGLVLTLVGERVLLMASETDAKQQEEEGEFKHYDDDSEESQDWKEEEGKNEKEEEGMEEQTQKNQEGKEYYDSGDYSVGTTYEGDEDYHEKSYEESMTESKELEEPDDYHNRGEGESEDYEKPEEYESNSEDGSGEQENDEGNSTEETDVEEDESTTESESREGKSTHGKGNVENNESENDEISSSYPKDNGEYHVTVPDTESQNQTLKVISNNRDMKGVEHDGNAATDKTDNKNHQLAEPMKSDEVKSIYVPEEMVSQTEYSRSEGSTNMEGSQDESHTTDIPGVTKLKETEEVQLAPVVYHVSPKLI